MSTDKPIFKLHIGMPKTGTKTLQVHMFPEHSGIDYLGTYIPYRGSKAKHCRDAEVVEFMNELIWKNRSNPDIGRCKALYEKWKTDAAAENKVLLWSWESLMEHKHRVQRNRAENLKEVAGEVSIVACLRHPVSLMKSLYIQLLKRDNLAAGAKWGSRHRFETIEDWMATGWDSPGQPPKAHLEYAETLEVFADVFGNDSVKILLFEQLVEDQETFVRDFCRQLGVDSEEGIRLVEGQRSNVGWTREQYDRLASLNDSKMLALRFRFANRKKRAEMLGIRSGVENTPEARLKVQISPEWIDRIEEKTKAGNRMLQDTWGIPLEQYGYPV